MFGLSHTPELILVLLVALIFLGPKRLPEAGRSLGQAIRGFKRETESMRNEFSGVHDEISGVHDEISSVSDTLKAESQSVRAEVLPAARPLHETDSAGADASPPPKNDG